MRNKMVWLVIKGVLILLLTGVIFLMPTDDPARKWFRFAMLVIFVTSFLFDLNNYKKPKA